MSSASSEEILRCIKEDTYPEPEQVIGAELSSPLLSQLQNALIKARVDAQNQIQRTSKSTAGDVDTWINRAKQVQADIERSKATARELVEHANTSDALQAKTADASAKVNLLEKELAFNDSLQVALHTFRDVAHRIAQLRDRVTHGQLLQASTLLRQVETTMPTLEQFATTRIHGLVANRLASAAAALTDRALDIANDRIVIDPAMKRVTIVDQNASSDVKFVQVVDILIERHAFTPWVSTLGERIRRVTFNAITMATRTNHTPNITINDKVLQIQVSTDSPIDTLAVVDTVERLIDFLHDGLPSPIATHISTTIMPQFLSDFELCCLNPGLPTELDQLGSLQKLLPRVSRLADRVHSLGWRGHEELTAWVDGAPGAWLQMQRGHALDSLRRSLGRDIQRRTTIERPVKRSTDRTDIVESTENSRMADAPVQDTWDDNWSDDAANVATASPTKPAAEADDDTSAWDVPDDDEPEGPHTADDDDAAEAWGWDNDDKPTVSPAQAPQGPENLDQPGSASLESLAVTGIPDGVVNLASSIFGMAGNLSSPVHATSPVSSAIPALWSLLPKYILPMYRATASSIYAHAAAGNMLLYNDTIYLVDQLNGLVQTRTHAGLQPAIRRSIEKELEILSTYGERAKALETDSQRTILLDHLDSAQGFTNCTAYPYSEACDSAVSMTVSRLRSVDAEWSPILSPTQLHSSIGTLLAEALKQFTNDILAQEDIGEEESKRLKRYADELASCQDLFPDPTGQPADDEPRSKVGLYVRNWFRFQYLAEVLESSLADIKYLWTEGELSLEFGNDEIADLVKALFADSDLRRKAVADIMRAR